MKNNPNTSASMQDKIKKLEGALLGEPKTNLTRPLLSPLKENEENHILVTQRNNDKLSYQVPATQITPAEQRGTPIVSQKELKELDKVSSRFKLSSDTNSVSVLPSQLFKKGAGRSL